MEASTDQDLEDLPVPVDEKDSLYKEGLLGVKISQAKPLENSIDNGSSSIGKSTPTRQLEPLSSKDSHDKDCQTYDRKRVIPRDNKYSSYAQPSDEVRQIQTVQHESQENNFRIRDGNRGLPGFCFPQQSLNPTYASNSTPVRHGQSLKPKTLISKDIQDLIRAWNSPSQEQSRTDRHLLFDQERHDDVQAILSDDHLVSIDKGAFGQVFVSSKKPTLVIKKTKELVNPNELHVPLQLTSCPHILKIYAAGIHNDMFYIVQQHCGESLRTLASNKNFQNFFQDINNRHNFIKGLFTVVEILENLRACHGDIKLENICAKYEQGMYVAIFIDFGTFQASHDKLTLKGTTPECLPPKVNDFALQYFVAIAYDFVPYELEKDTKKAIHEKLRDFVDRKWGANQTVEYLREAILQQKRKQNSFLFDEKSDSWAIAIVIICLLQAGEHPIKEVNCYAKVDQVDLPQRIGAMMKIAALQDKDVDNLVPSNVDQVTKDVLCGNLRVNHKDRWGAQKTVVYLTEARRQQQRSMSSDVGKSRKRGKKRPVSPFHPATPRYENKDDKGVLKKKPPDDVNVTRLKPPVARQGGSVKIAHTMNREVCDLDGFNVRLSSQNIFPPEDEATVKVTSPPCTPNFHLLGIECDMDQEPSTNNPTTLKVTAKACEHPGNTNFFN